MNCVTLWVVFLMLLPDISRVTSDVVRWMSVTKFIGFCLLNLIQEIGYPWLGTYSSARRNRRERGILTTPNFLCTATIEVGHITPERGNLVQNIIQQATIMLDTLSIGTLIRNLRGGGSVSRDVFSRVTLWFGKKNWWQFCWFHLIWVCEVCISCILNIYRVGRN